jgi:hypothetical protein
MVREEEDLSIVIQTLVSPLLNNNLIDNLEDTAVT